MSQIQITLLEPIGPVSLARENEAGDNWGQEVHILHDFVLCLTVIIELFQSNYFSYSVRRIITSRNREHFAGENAHGNHEFQSIVMMVAMASPVCTCVWRS